MRQRFWFLSVFLFLLLCACGTKPDETTGMVQPFSFYYRTVQTDYSASDGVIRAEVRDLGADSYSDAALFALYMNGPESPDLSSPLPTGCELLHVSRNGATLVLSFRQAYNALTGINQSIADACLLKTALELDGIRQVHLRIQSNGGQILRDATLSENDILLFDSGEYTSGTDFVLYYADEDGMYLHTEKRSVPAMSPSLRPRFVIEALMQAPETGRLCSPLPQGTDCFGTNVDMGICSVDLNGDFYQNRPATERDELITLYSIVNSLCELDGVEQVQFYIEGRKQTRYCWMDISNPFTADPSVAVPIRADMNEFEGILCLPGSSDPLLHRLPVRVRANGGSSQAEALIHSLFSKASQNGLSNPTEGLEPPRSVTTSGSLCTVEFAAGTVSELSASGRQLVLRCVTASLCQLDGIDRVQILEQNQPLTDAPLSPEASWFCAG